MESVILSFLGKSKSKSEQVLYSKFLGFLKLWIDSDVILKLTALMSDVSGVFRYLEKELKSNEIILLDIPKYRDRAVRKLNTISVYGNLPGGKLELVNKFLSEQRQDTNSSVFSSSENRRSVRNTLVTTLHSRSFDSIKCDIVDISKQRLLTRLDSEQDKILRMIIQLVTCVTPEKFISTTVDLFQYVPVTFTQFVDSVIENWEKMKPPTVLLLKGYGSKLLHMIRNSPKHVQIFFLSSFTVVCPHSVAV